MNILKLKYSIKKVKKFIYSNNAPTNPSPPALDAGRYGMIDWANLLIGMV